MGRRGTSTASVDPDRATGPEGEAPETDDELNVFPSGTRVGALRCAPARLLGSCPDLRRTAFDLVFALLLIRRERTWDCARTRRYDEPSNDPGPLSPHQFYSDCIIAARGYDFREGDARARDSFFSVLAIPIRIASSLHANMIFRKDRGRLLPNGSLNGALPR